MTITEWLDSPCTGHYCNGSWRQWFADLLNALWLEGESFDGKRPGENDSDWWFILMESLIEFGLLEEGYDYGNAMKVMNLITAELTSTEI